jgi:hypothetical protein
VLLGLVSQGVFLIGVISLLLVRRSEILHVDRKIFSRKSDEVEALARRVASVTERIRTERGIENIDTFFSVIRFEQRFLEANPEIAAAFDQWDTLERQLEDLEGEVEGLNLGWARTSFGYFFAIVAIGTIVVGCLESVRHGSSERVYASLSILSCTCAASAYALLGRRQTNERKFLSDLRSVGATFDVLRGLAWGAPERDEETRERNS